MELYSNIMETQEENFVALLANIPDYTPLLRKHLNERHERTIIAIKHTSRELITVALY